MRYCSFVNHIGLCQCSVTYSVAVFNQRLGFSFSTKTVMRWEGQFPEGGTRSLQHSLNSDRGAWWVMEFE